MDFFEVVKKRCSVREYKNASIPREDLEKIVDAARLAPTGRGEEPWEFIVVTERNRLCDIARMATPGEFIKDAAACIVVLCKETKYYLEDGCAATENILLAATALGIGSCWVAGDKKPYTTSIMQYLGVPKGYKLVSIVSLGYPERGFLPHQKRALKNLLHFEKF